MSQVDEFHYHPAIVAGKECPVAYPTAPKDCKQCYPKEWVAQLLRQHIAVEGSNVVVANVDRLADELVRELYLDQWFETWDDPPDYLT